MNVSTFVKLNTVICKKNLFVSFVCNASQRKFWSNILFQSVKS